MESKWPIVGLADVLVKSEEWIDVKPDITYREVTVRLWGKGVTLRQEISGAKIASSRRLVVHPQQFILSRIDARNGAFGLIPNSLDGAIVSNDFPVFNLNVEKIEPKYLEWMSKTRDFVELCISASEGTTNRVRLKENRFLSAEISLPPLAEQKRIVAKIDALAVRIEEARKLRHKAVGAADALKIAELTKFFNTGQKNWDVLPIEKSSIALNLKTRNPAHTNSNTEFQYLDISSVEGGTGRISSTQKLLGINAPSRARRVIRKGDIVMSTVRPNLKSFAIVPSELDNQICSTGFAVFSVHQDIEPKFLLYQMFSDYFVNQCVENMKGGHYPAINEKNLRKIHIIRPPLTDQRRIVSYLDKLQEKVDALKKLQQETEKELDALLPSVLNQAFNGGIEN